jgi:hypothetical protein
MNVTVTIENMTSKLSSRTPRRRPRSGRRLEAGGWRLEEEVVSGQWSVVSEWEGEAPAEVVVAAR